MIRIHDSLNMALNHSWRQKEDVRMGHEEEKYVMKGNSGCDLTQQASVKKRKGGTHTLCSHLL